MINLLNQVNGKTYSRAIEPSVEGRLRPQHAEVLTRPRQTAVNQRSEAQSQQQPQRQESQYLVRDEQQAKQASQVGEQLANQIKQAKQTQVKFRPTANYLTTRTGQRANQSYQAPLEMRHASLVDEIA